MRPRRRPLYRLELDCGHVAYALPGEERAVGRRRPCASCSATAWELIVTSEELS